MKRIIFTGIITLLAFSNISCKQQPPTPQPTPGINIACQRLTSCYNSYQNQIKDNNIVNIVITAQRNGVAAGCSSAAQQLEVHVGQDCPF